MASDESGRGTPQCYHYDCERSATRWHYSTMDLASDPAPCCDDHNPMAKTREFVPIEERQTELATDGGEDCGRGGPHAELGLEVKETERRGKLLCFSDDAAPSGFRGMTDAEMQAHDYIKNLVAEFDSETVEPGRVGTVHVPEDGTPYVEWCSDEAAAAAGGEYGGE